MTTDLLPAAQDRPLSARFDARRDECGAAWCRRADLRETISDYLIRELERYGVAIRDRIEIAELHGGDGRLARSQARRLSSNANEEQRGCASQRKNRRAIAMSDRRRPRPAIGSIDEPAAARR